MKLPLNHISNMILLSWFICFVPLIYGLYIPQFIFNLNFLKDVKNVKDQEFDSWILQQKKISFNSILDNIGGSSKYLPDTVLNGVVIASPSKSNPNYYYQWTRDAALTMKSLILEISDMKFINASNISTIVESYIENQYYIQRIDNLSGNWTDPNKSSLGEPKFLPDNTPFNEVWGRPQRDGPGLRVATIIHYVNLLENYKQPLTNQFLNDTSSIYFQIVKPDLTYIIHNWKEIGFDLWEEINSHHFFTSITQLRALLDGIAVAKHFNDLDDFVNELQATFDQLNYFITHESGFVAQFPYILESPELVRNGKRTGLDAATLLGSIHSHPLTGTFNTDYNLIPFNTNSTFLLNTLNAMVADMKYRYPINYGHIGDISRGVALGRYPEDVYDGHAISEGNPWFISTATAAEVIYRYTYQLKTNPDDIIINQDNIEFFHQFIDSNMQTNDIIEYGSIVFESLLEKLFKYADTYLEVIQEHIDDNGNISEQFNKYNGYMQGARQLTWSHSALWNAFRWRSICNSTLHI